MSDASAVPVVVTRVARVLLACYPRWFREAHGPAFLDGAAHRWRREIARGRHRSAATRATVALLLVDALRAVPDAWRFRLRDRPPAHRGAWAGALGFELRYALRVVVRSPVFSLVAVASLAIGIGANTAIYRAARYAILDPLPVSQPEALRLVHWLSPQDVRASQYNSSGDTDPETGRAVRSNVNHAMYVGLREAGGAAVAGFNFTPPLAVSRAGQPAVAAGGLVVSGNWFDVMSPGMALGRPIVESDDDPAAPPVVVLGYGFWVRRFGANPGVIGSVLEINGSSFTVIGVTARGFHGISTGGRITPLTDVTVPLSAQQQVWPQETPLASAPDILWIRTLARVADDESGPALESRLTASLRRGIAESGIAHADSLAVVRAVLLPGARGVDGLRQRAQGPVVLLAGVVALVLVIACANLAGLMLARGVARQREMAVRRALGSGRARLLRQLFLESLLLSVAGGVTGLALAWGTTPFVNAMLAAGLGVPVPSLPLDARTLAVALTVSVVAALLFGLLPAARLTGGDETMQLRHRAAGMDPPRLRAGRLLLAVQIGVSIPLVVATGLLLRTVANLGATDLGFDAEGVIVVRTELPRRAGGADEDRAQLSRRLLERVEAIAGVRSATLVENVLLSGWISNNTANIEGVDRTIQMNAVGPRFFETMGMQLVTGRSIGAQDASGAQAVVVINEAAAREYFAGVPAVGRRFRYGRTEAEVVGIVRDSRYRNVRTAVQPTLYDSWLQRGGGWLPNLLLRVGPGVTGIEPELRRAVADVSPDIVIAELRRQTDYVSDSVSREQLMTRLLTVFGAFALLLACIGLYGVASYSVARRTHEIGIRIALGAERPRVLWLVLRQVLLLAGAGLAIGVPAALAASPLIRSLLFGLGPRDPATILLASAVMVAVATGAGLLPAIRASRMEVFAALRRE